jgi:hypothetical protein
MAISVDTAVKYVAAGLQIVLATRVLPRLQLARFAGRL